MLRLRKGVAKFGGKKPNKAAIKLPLRDGDIERDDEAYKGHYFINANSTTAPQIVDRAVKPILDRSEVYSGCYARVSLNFYAFNSNGNKGIACGLGNIQKIRDGESLGGKTTAADTMEAECNKTLPVSEKYMLTIKEAAAYFNIGIKRLRRIAEDNLGTVAVYCGNRFLIIRPKFEEFILNSSEI